MFILTNRLKAAAGPRLVQIDHKHEPLTVIGLNRCSVNLKCASFACKLFIAGTNLPALLSYEQPYAKHGPQQTMPCLTAPLGSQQNDIAGYPAACRSQTLMNPRPETPTAMRLCCSLTQ